MRKTISLLLIFLLIPVRIGLAQYTADSLFLAIRKGDMATIEKILQNESDQKTLDTALGAAVAGNQAEIIRFLVNKGADVNHISSFDTPLLLNAIMYKQFQAAEVLIELGVDVNVIGFKKQELGMQVDWHWTAVMCAAYQGNLELVELLDQKGADIFVQGWSRSKNDLESAADIAAYTGHLEVLKYLMKAGAEIQQETLFKVVRGGHLNTLKFLIDNTVNLNQVGRELGKTLLMESCWWGHKEIVNFFLQKGADPNQLSRDGYTALNDAVINAKDAPRQYLEIIKMLIKAGLDVNYAGTFKMTPLMRAVEADAPKEIVEYLMSQGAR